MTSFVVATALSKVNDVFARLFGGFFDQKGRSRWSALFCALPITTSTWVIPASAAETEADCFSTLSREKATIERVSDGDTVVLSDRRRVRLIGINAAELNADDPMLKAAAIEATNTLSAWLPSGEVVWLFIGAESHDRHGRLLAHVVRVQNALAVAPNLISKGLAAQSAVKPNTLCAKSFALLERQAAIQKRGLWDNDPFNLDARDANQRTSGFHIVQGVVSGVVRKKRYTELAFNTDFTLRVRTSLAKTISVDELVGQPVEVRGWVSQKKNNPYLWLHHPANLRQLPTGH